MYNGFFSLDTQRLVDNFFPLKVFQGLTALALLLKIILWPLFLWVWEWKLSCTLQVCNMVFVLKTHTSVLYHHAHKDTWICMTLYIQTCYLPWCYLSPLLSCYTHTFLLPDGMRFTRFEWNCTTASDMSEHGTGISCIPFPWEGRIFKFN